MTQGEVLAEVARILNRLGIDWCLVGSYATSAHGEPRTTHDIDIQIVMSEADIVALVDALGEDYYADAESIVASFNAGLPHNLIHQETQDKIDLWPLKQEGYELTQFERRIRFMHLGEAAYVQTPEDAILSKLKWMQQAQSPRHLEDALGVVLATAERLDMPYLRKWAQHLGLSERLGQLLAEAAR